MQLAVFIARRVAVLIPTLFFVSVLIFSLQKLLPGDAAIALAGEESDPAVVAGIRAKYHLDRPVVVQYGIWMGKVLRGDLGESLRNKIPVTELLASKLPVTVELAVCSMLVALLIGIPTGVLSAVRRGTAIDVAANAVALSGLSVPHFWLGIMLILLFAVRLGWLPASGYVPPWEDLGRNLTTILMPSFVLGTGVAGVMMRHTRGAMLQVLSTDYVRTARAKSVPERLVVVKHALRNALIPVITLGAIEFGRLLSGAVLTEQIFAIPGFGKMLVDGVFNRDYAVVQGVVLVSAGLYVFLNLLADILYFLANPRLRGAHERGGRRDGHAGGRRDTAAVRAATAAPAAAGRDRRGGGGGVRHHRGGRATTWRPTIRSSRTSWRYGRRPRTPTGSGPTRSAATSSRASSGGRGPRCWPGSSRSRSRWSSASRWGSCRGAPAAGSTGSSCGSPTPCWPSRSSSWPSRWPPSWARASPTP